VNEDARRAAEFARRWLEKADGYGTSRTEDAFDRFFSEFVAFNRLYSHFNRRSAHPGTYDSTQATSVFVAAVGAASLMGALESDGAEADIQLLAALIDPVCGDFYLISDRTHGGRDTRANEKLHARLGSRSRNERAIGVLTYLYKLRCNMFHGGKGFERTQMQILQPAARVLRRIVEFGLSSLE